MDLATFRREKDRFMKTHPQAPLTSQQQKTFQGLNYFPENPALRFETALIPDPQRPQLQMATSTGADRTFRRIGSFAFTVAGIQQRLFIYQDEDGGDYFLPFMDETTGKETYGAGRYVEVEPLPGNRLRVDFNMAYNPYCAYNESWSCPIPPLENTVAARIEAGEKVYHQ